MSETTIGSIVGFLRLDADQFHREIVKAITEVEALDGKRASVKLDVDSSGVDATMDRTGAAAERTEKSLAKVDRQSRQTSGGMRMLVTAVLALGPALVPLAAGVAGLALGFGGLGIAGAAAVLGIMSEVKKATLVGQTYRAETERLQGALEGVATIAAGNLLGPYQLVVKDLIARTPALTRQVSDLSNMVGHAAVNLSGGLLSAFLALEPLMRDAGGYVVGLTAAFREAMSGPGVVSFSDYVRSVFPQVVDTVERLVEAGAHLIAAYAPLGLGTLTLLGAFADLINAIPVEVLQVIAPLATGVFVAFQLWRGLSPMVDAFGRGLERVGASAQVAATGMRVLNIATGVIGAALAVLSFIFTANAESQRQAEQAANDYADALRASNGVIDESIRQMAAKRLSDAGALEAAKLLGIALPTVTSAALGEAGAMAEVTAAIEANSRTKRSSTSAYGVSVSNSNKAADAADVLREALLGENNALTEGIKKRQEVVAASAATESALSNEAIVTSALADRYGVSAATYSAVVASQEKLAEKSAQATLKMQLENDAAGLLKQSLDALSGKALSAAQAQNGFDRAMVNLGKSTRDAKGNIDKAKTSLSGMGESAVTNRGNLLGLAQQANGVAEAVANQTGSTEKGRQKLIAMRKQIIDNAVAQGLNRAEVQKFIDTVLKVPTKVPPTKADADTTAARRKMTTLRDEIRQTMRDRTANMFVNVFSNVQSAVAGIVGSIGAIGATVGRRDGGPIPGYAGGGKLRGPGTGTSDSIVAVVRETGRPVMVSTGEYVSTADSTKRNEAALAAGNRGAQLGVVGESEPIDYERLAQTLVAAMSRVTLRPQIAAGSVDRGLGFAL